MSYNGESTTDKCRNCGETENLMKCTRCSSAAYCSKNCQTTHWPEHKMICKMVSKAAKANNDLDAIGNMIKSVQKQGIKTVKLISTHAGCLSSDDKEMPAGVPDNFLFLHEASQKFAMLGKEKRVYGEHKYKKLYDDLVANEKEWMEFFAHFANYNHAGDCAMVLQPLTTIYYDRGNYEACGQVLEMHEKVLHHFKQQVARLEDDGFTEFCVWGEYNTNKTWYELNLRLKQHTKNVPLFKELCQFEMSHMKQDDQYLYKR